jgi:hypothetical protein
MLEQSVERFFQEMADSEQPHPEVSIQQLIAQGHKRLRRRRLLRAVASTAVAAVVAGLLPSVLGQISPQAGGYGRFVDGAFNPSYLSVEFGYLPAGERLESGEITPSAESIAGGSQPSLTEWTVTVFARNVCHLAESGRRFECRRNPGTMGDLIGPAADYPVISQGPPVNGRSSVFLEHQQGLAGAANLAWEYAPGAWAEVQKVQGPGDAATAVLIASGIEYHKHIPLKYGATFTRLNRGWRVLDLAFQRDHGPLEVWQYQIARLRDISPATDLDFRYPWANELTVRAASPPDEGFPLSSCGVGQPAHGRPVGLSTPDQGTQQVTIHGARFSLEWYSKARTPGVVATSLMLCRWGVDGMGVMVQQEQYGAHPVSRPTRVMERMRLLGPNPAKWATSPLR